MSKVGVDFHLDIFNNEIRKGSFVVTNWVRSDLQLCLVTKILPKTVQIRRVVIPEKQGFNSLNIKKNKYSSDMMVVDENENVTLYILKNATSN